MNYIKPDFTDIDRAEILNTFVEVTIPENAFKKIVEVLTRTGLPNDHGDALYQVCHIFHKRGRYYIVHWKEMLMLDGKLDSLTQLDLLRRNTILGDLVRWGLVDCEQTNLPVMDIPDYITIPHKDKEKWRLVPKYHIGGPAAR
jgi:hypothetical protein